MSVAEEKRALDELVRYDAEEEKIEAEKREHPYRFMLKKIARIIFYMLVFIICAALWVLLNNIFHYVPT